VASPPTPSRENEQPAKPGVGVTDMLRLSLPRSLLLVEIIESTRFFRRKREGGREGGREGEREREKTAIIGPL